MNTVRTLRYFFVLTAAAFGLLLGTESARAVPTISGTVRNSQTAFGIAGIDLDVFDSASGLAVTVTSAPTDVNGVYTITLPDAGTYLVRADPSRTDGFIDQFYNGVTLKSQATPLTLGINTALTGIDFSLSIGHDISGQVTSNAVGVDGIDLDVFASNGEFLSGVPGTTAGGGFFALGALPPGTYYIRADPDPALGQYYLHTFYGGSPDIAGAAPITITSSSVGGINIALTPGGAIGGTVRAQSSGLPIVGIDLDLYDATGARVSVNASTAADGTYVIGSVPPGNYRLRVDPTIAQGYPRMYHANALNLTQALTIPVAAGSTTPGIDFSLPVAGSISGTIRSATTTNPIANIDLDCFDMAGNRVDLTAKSAVNGTYQIGPMPAGTYFLRADPTPTQGYLLQYYLNQPDRLTAAGIVVNGGANTGSIDFSLGDAGWISGTVRGPGATPLAGIDLDLYDAVTGLRQTLGGTTNPDGTYLIGPVATGDYKLRCDPTIAQGYAVEYWNAQVRLSEANTFAVAAAAGTPGIDFVLEVGGSVSGVVTSRTSGQPILGIDIDLIDTVSGKRLDQSAKTNALGQYSVGPVPPGTYILRADAPASFPFADLYYVDSTLPATATVLTINAGTNLIDINLALQELALAGSVWLLY